MRARWKSHPILERFEAELDDLRARDQFRELPEVEGINLSSNDYLALSDDPRLRFAIMRGLEEGPRWSSTGSRLLSGNARDWEKLESQLASFAGTEAALYFSSGYLANVGLLSAVLQREATAFSDSANHASLIDGIRLSGANKIIFPHLDLDFLESALRRSGPGERFIIVESIFSMEGDRAPLDDLYGLAEKYDAQLIIDEAHATGVVGPGGRGLAAGHGRSDCVLATVHTCGKALASMGAFVASTAALRHYLINKARTFVFSTALPPYVAAQTSEAIRISIDADDRRAHLQELATYLRSRLRELGFDTRHSDSQIVPAILGSNEKALEVAARLSDCGFGVKAIRPPTVPKGTSRLRFSLTSRLTKSDLESLVQALRDAIE